MALIGRSVTPRCFHTRSRDWRVGIVDASGMTTLKISAISGKDTTQFSIIPSRNVSGYQIRVVPASNSPVTSGQLLEQGFPIIAAGASYAVDVTNSEATAALAVEGNNVIKVFVMDQANGLWSS